MCNNKCKYIHYDDDVRNTNSDINYTISQEDIFPPHKKKRKKNSASIHRESTLGLVEPFYIDVYHVLQLQPQAVSCAAKL